MTSWLNESQVIREKCKITNGIIGRKKRCLSIVFGPRRNEDLDQNAICLLATRIGGGIGKAIVQEFNRWIIYSPAHRKIEIRFITCLSLACFAGFYIRLLPFS
jgi:hypothetical protein